MTYKWSLAGSGDHRANRGCGLSLYDILEQQLALFPDLFRSYEKAAEAAIDKVRAGGSPRPQSEGNRS
ncbi:hypothetical protein [Paraburkholderia fungorum]|jgi:hypothetical protein|uniref:Uncharacterized protein n=1 Tax=Paraburkholderia fungorum TaxID=134537 RepID=A0AAW3V479_9BURK|nr:hypothetical protein [Paraburkholderia fungorum]AJZ56179.1 hypothetical protein OI25_8089 [Paraburkholderia fungorum]MBB4516392.1 hypothetical protein [Paraburkholderia fungorum]MBB5547814.1 hypothetical protein [Paraburkholderia fungorum]MBB6205136.1 hypothetical protein [Paraburkholderia fungorum]MBU7440738.1 hypothetical protein [Paraburkholderia fungorum]